MATEQSRDDAAGTATGGTAKSGLLGTTARKIAAGAAGIVLIGGGVLLVTRDDGAPTEEATAPAETTAPAPTTVDVDASDSATSTDDVTDVTLGQEEPTAVGDTDAIFDAEDVDVPPCGELPPGSTPAADNQFLQIVSTPSEVRCEPLPAGEPPLCEPTVIPCDTGLTPPFVVAGATPGVTHQETTTDWVTGESGPSTAMFDQYVDPLGNPIVIVVASDCGGTILTGGSPCEEPGVVRVNHPLLWYGSCGAVRWTALPVTDDEASGDPLLEFPMPGGMPPGWELYQVGPDEVAPGAPPPVDGYVIGNDRYVVQPGWDTDARTILNTLSGNAIPTPCTPFTVPGDPTVPPSVPDGCVDTNDYWAFAAGIVPDDDFDGADIVLAHGAGYVNPYGEFDPSVLDEAIASATAHGLFGDGSPTSTAPFPCGHGHLGYTVCPPEPTVPDYSALVVVNIVMLEHVLLETDDKQRVYTVDFTEAGGPFYRMYLDENGWQLSPSLGFTEARMIVRGNSITLLAPQTEVPAGAAYELTVTVDDRNVVQPVVRPSGLITTPAVTADPSVPQLEADLPEATESLDEFYGELSTSIATGDLGFSLDRLDPHVLQMFPDSCPATIAGYADPEFEITLVSEDGRGPWTWELGDGRSVEIPQAVEATISLGGRGQTGEPNTTHLTIIDGQYHWFTICDGS